MITEKVQSASFMETCTSLRVMVVWTTICILYVFTTSSQLHIWNELVPWSYDSFITENGVLRLLKKLKSFVFVKLKAWNGPKNCKIVSCRQKSKIMLSFCMQESEKCRGQLKLWLWGGDVTFQARVLYEYTSPFMVEHYSSVAGVPSHQATWILLEYYLKFQFLKNVMASGLIYKYQYHLAYVFVGYFADVTTLNMRDVLHILLCSYNCNRFCHNVAVRRRWWKIFSVSI